MEKSNFTILKINSSLKSLDYYNLTNYLVNITNIVQECIVSLTDKPLILSGIEPNL